MSNTKMRKIRILFLPLVDAVNINAQSLNVREIVTRLNTEQFEFSLFYMQEPDHKLLNRSHIRLLRLPARLKTFRLLREMFSGYDIIGYMDFSPASYIFLHCPKSMRRRTKVVMHVESLSQMEDVSGMLKFLYAGIAPRCDFYTGITERSARDFVSVMHRKVSHVLPIGVNCRLYSSTRDVASRQTTVLFVGTLVERKRVLLVLAAAARFPNAKFCIIGPDRHGFVEIVKRRISALGLRNVSLEGAKPQEVIARAMQESDILLLPSRIEGMPKVTLEAAASGLPCIVFRDYETPSVVDGLTGFQVSTEDEMMDKLALLLDDAQLRERMGIEARKHAEKFDWDTIAQCWQNAYLEIASME